MSRKPKKSSKPNLPQPPGPQDALPIAPQAATAARPQATESDGFSQVEPDDVNVGLLGLIGLFIAVVLFLIVVLVQAWFYDWKGDLVAGRTASVDISQTPVSQALVEQQAQINSYRWVNRDEGVRAIPIQRAMELVTKELAAEQLSANERGEP